MLLICTLNQLLNKIQMLKYITLFLSIIITYTSVYSQKNTENNFQLIAQKSILRPTTNRDCIKTFNSIDVQYNSINNRLKYNIIKPNDASYEIGSAIIAASLLTSIFLAPLVSTNLKNGDVNNPRLFKWIGIGIAGLAVGIPITLISKGDSKKLTKYKNR